MQNCQKSPLVTLFVSITKKLPFPSHAPQRHALSQPYRGAGPPRAKDCAAPPLPPRVRECASHPRLAGLRSGTGVAIIVLTGTIIVLTTVTQITINTMLGRHHHRHHHRHSTGTATSITTKPTII